MDLTMASSLMSIKQPDPIPRISVARKFYSFAGNQPQIAKYCCRPSAMRMMPIAREVTILPSLTPMYVFLSRRLTLRETFISHHRRSAASSAHFLHHALHNIGQGGFCTYHIRNQHSTLTRTSWSEAFLKAFSSSSGDDKLPL